MEKSLVDLKALSKPMTKLIGVLADGLGTLYAPFGTVRQAKAEAAAMIIRAKAENEVASLHERANARYAHREALRQQNLEAISSVAAQEMPETVSDESVDPDWLSQFLNRAQDVSDEDMQTIWGKILAGEVANPGAYSKRTLQFLETMDKNEALAFTSLCSHAFQDSTGWFVLFESEFVRELYAEAVGSNGYIDHFISIGLVGSELYMPGNADISGRKVQYFGRTYEFVGPPAPDPGKLGITPLQTPVCNRLFTQIGQQLALIAGAEEIPEYIPKVSEGFRKQYEVEIRAAAS